MFERTYYDRNDDGKKNGTTVVVINDGKHSFVGLSFCDDRDQFDKKRGRQIATGRAKYVQQIVGGEKRIRGQLLGFSITDSQVQNTEEESIPFRHRIHLPKEDYIMLSVDVPKFLLEIKKPYQGAEDEQS